MKHQVIPVLLSFVAAILPSCSGQEGFSEKEIQVISAVAPDGRTDYGGKIMKVLKTDNRGDSLFLRQVAEPVSGKMMKTEEFRKLCDRMLATVRDSLDEGVGIAAPQVGISRKIIFVQRFDKEDSPFGCYVNPEIISRSDSTVTGMEGCLSVPGVTGEVSRSESIVLKYDTPEVQDTVETIRGFTAVIFQHEIDHLSGILFVDLLSDN